MTRHQHPDGEPSVEESGDRRDIHIRNLIIVMIVALGAQMCVDHADTPMPPEDEASSTTGASP